MSNLNELPLERYPRERFAGVGGDGSFSLQDARANCWISQLAYESDPVKVSNIASSWGFVDVTMFERRIAVPLPSTDSKGIILTGDHAVVLAFAGTDPLNFANWITNFDWVPKSGDLHTGFRMATDAAWQDTRSAVERANQRSVKICIAGHSLGGAIAALTANRLQRELGIVADIVYTTACRGRAVPAWSQNTVTCLAPERSDLCMATISCRPFRLINWASGMWGGSCLARALASLRHLHPKIGH